jgi:hypothetical protein
MTMTGTKKQTDAPPDSPWRRRVGKFTAFNAILELKRETAVPYTRPPKLAELESAALQKLQSSPAIAKLAAVSERLQRQQATVAAAREELATAEKRFDAVVGTMPDDHHDEGSEIVSIKFNLQEQENLLAKIQAAYDQAKAEAEATVTASNESTRAQQLDYLRPLVTAAEHELLAALVPLLEKVGEIDAARSFVMRSMPFTLESILPQPAKETAPAPAPAPEQAAELATVTA